MKLRIKNWKKFQHFKDRRPPWVKVYREILDDEDIMTISDRSFRVLILLWLLASEDKSMKGNLPPVKTIAFRLRMTEREINKALQELRKFVYQSDITVLSGAVQVGPSETETETETETEPRARKKPSKHEESFKAFWKEYPNKKAVAKARAAWKKAQGALPDIDIVLAAIQKQKQSQQWKKEQGQYIPHPATWINGACWEDETETQERIDYGPGVMR